MAATTSRTSAENLEIQARLDKVAARRQLTGKIIPYMGLVFLLVFFSIVTGGKFLSPANLSNMIEQCFTMALVATGASFVYAHGNMDFSIGAACGVAQMCGAILFLQAGVPFPAAMLAALAVPVGTCLLVFLISVVFKVPVFIGSMCIRSLLMGILTIGVSRAEIIIPVSQYPYMTSGVVKAVILVLVIGTGVYLFHYTPIGKWGRAIGGNRNTARQAGVKVNRQMLLAYVFLGLCVGIASVFQMFRASTVSINSGSGIEFNIMLAIVLGGFPMSGGEKASVPSAVLGAVIATLLVNGLALWGLDANLVNGVKGVIFVIMIALSYDRSAGKLVS